MNITNSAKKLCPQFNYHNNNEHQRQTTNVNYSKTNNSSDNILLNGISHFKHDTRNGRPAFINQNKESCHQINKNSKLILKREHIQSSPKVSLNTDTSNVIRRNTEPEMPNLTRETDSDQRHNSLAGSSVFNQRFQNVRQFPNYCPRKKGTFERKLKRCGLELDKEVTISILRQFLQPFIYRDINCILDDYIKKYFLKAFDNIRENINFTSENWSQVLKCDISKSLYKQYCIDATIDPFNPQSADLTDFSYFPPTCKSSNIICKKTSDEMCEKLTENIIEIPDIVSDSNSEESNISKRCDQFEMTNHLNMIEDSHNHKSFVNSELHPNQTKKSNYDICRKRNNQTTEIVVDQKCFKEPSNHFTCSSPKHSNDEYLNKISRSYSHKLPRQSFLNHRENKSQFPKSIHINHQKLVNNGFENFDTIQQVTAPFESKTISFCTPPLNLSSISKNSPECNGL